MSLRTEHLSRCIATLEKSLAQLRLAPAESIDYEVYRNAVVKGFELTLETVGNLLRKALKSYAGSPRTVDELPYKDLFRHAAKHGLIDTAMVERWFGYRDNRNATAHNYGVKLAEQTLVLLPGFIDDARRIETVLRERFGHADT